MIQHFCFQLGRSGLAPPLVLCNILNEPAVVSRKDVMNPRKEWVCIGVVINGKEFGKPTAIVESREQSDGKVGCVTPPERFDVPVLLANLFQVRFENPICFNPLCACCGRWSLMLLSWNAKFLGGLWPRVSPLVHHDRFGNIKLLDGFFCHANVDHNGSIQNHDGQQTTQHSTLANRLLLSSLRWF